MKRRWQQESNKSEFRVGIYIRKSREVKEKPSYRLSVQRTQLPEYATAQGWEYWIYDDGHASAARGKTDDLAQRRRLEQDIRAGKINLVLSIELSRFSRDDSAEDYDAWLSLCRDHGVLVGTPGRILDPRNPSEWFLLHMEGGLSSMEMQVLAIRMAEGRKQAFDEGKWLGGTPPPPYRYSKDLKKPVVDDELLVECREIWSLAETTSARGIAMQLGVPEIAVRRAISDDRLLMYQALRPCRETGELIGCDWEPVMDAEQAGRIKQARRSRKNYTTRRYAAALLSNMQIAYCGYCDRTIKVWLNTKSRVDGHRIDYYGCQSKSQKGACPSSRMIKQHDLDSRVITNLIGTLECLDDLKAYWLAEHAQSEPRDAMTQLAEKESRLMSWRKNIIDSIAEGILTAVDAKQKLAEIKDGLNEVAVERSNIMSRASAAVAPDWGCLELSREEFDRLDFENKRSLIKAAVERIDVFENYAIITYKFPRRPSGDRTARIHLPPSARRPKQNRRRAKRVRPEGEVS